MSVADFGAPVARNDDVRSDSWVTRARETDFHARFPERDHRPPRRAAVLDVASSRGFPRARATRVCTAAHVGGTHFAQFPGRNVSSPRSHLRRERVAVRRSHRAVARPMVVASDDLRLRGCPRSAITARVTSILSGCPSRMFVSSRGGPNSYPFVRARLAIRSIARLPARCCSSSRP